VSVLTDEEGFLDLEEMAGKLAMSSC
jgi:hypothetical protein